MTPLLMLGLVSCGGDGATPTPPPPVPTPASITLAAGDAQTADAGAAVAIAPAVVVRNAQGQPMVAVPVQFSVVEGGGVVTGGSPATDAAGVARVTDWTLGEVGTQRLVAQVGALPPVSFQATLTPGTETTSVVIGPGGGSIQVITPGHPLQGLALTVPSGTFSTAGDVSIRVAKQAVPPVMPSGYRVTGPVLEVHTAAQRGTKLMTLEVPVTRVANEDIVLALHDPVRRITEVLPTVARGTNSITVMTSHLRADLMPGPIGAAGPSQVAGNGPSPNFPIGQSGWLMQVAFPLPQPSVLPVINPAIHRWPVLDHGSASSPNGFGPGIPALVRMLAKTTPSLASQIEALDTPGFYAEAAPLVTAQTVQGKLVANLGSLLQQFTAAAAPLAKSIRDEMTHRNLLAGLAISQETIVTALLPAGGGDPVYVNGVAGSETSLTFLSPAGIIAAVLGRTAGAGYLPLAAERTPDQPPVAVESAVPLSSAFLSLNNILIDVQALLQTTGLPAGSPQREAANRLMATTAGLTLPVLEIEAEAGGGWHRLAVGAVGAIRSLSTRVRGDPAGAPVVMMHAQGGAEAAQIEAQPVVAEAVAGLTDGAEAVVMVYTVSSAEMVSNRPRQIVPVANELVWVPFQVVPDQFLLKVDSSRVVFDAAVPYPPADGYRIKWEWGDGSVTVVTNNIRGEYDYPQPANRQVIATLLPASGATVLAKDTAEVRIGTPMWRLTTFEDPDGYLDIDDDPGHVDPFEAILANPASGLIGVIAVPGGSEMRLWAKAAGVWTDTDCCPPTFSPSGQIVVLGAMPETFANLGPFFSQWRQRSWLGDDLSSGVWSAHGLGSLRNYDVKNGGTQVGPEYATELVATVQGKHMVGTIKLYGWFQDEDTGEVEDTTVYRFYFQAVRLR